MSGGIHRLYDICAEATGVSVDDLPLGPRRDQASWLIASLVAEGSPPAWPDPVGTRNELDALITDIRRLKARISRLDGYSLALARTSTPEVVAMDACLEAALAAGEDPRHAVGEWLAARAQPREMWVDYAAIAHLDSLEEGLAAVARTARESAAWRPNGSAGRRPARAAYRVALSAARIYRLLKGEEPGFWNDKNRPTPYGHMLTALFSELGITADIRRPAEWAVGQNDPQKT